MSTSPESTPPGSSTSENPHPEHRPPPSLNDIKPWEGQAKAGDKVLLGFIFGVPLLYLVLLPLRPFLIAKMPVVLALITGAKTVVAGAGAFAAVEDHSVLLVIAAGTLGMLKFDWLWWLAGRRWGEGVVRLFAGTPKQKRQFASIKKMPHWLLCILLFFGRWPGVPGAIVSLISGWGRMSFPVYFIASSLGSAALATGCALLGYIIGEPAVVLLRTIDKYAMWISLGLIVGLVVWSRYKSQKKGNSAQLGATSDKAGS